MVFNKSRFPFTERGDKNVKKKILKKLIKGIDFLIMSSGRFFTIS